MNDFKVAIIGAGICGLYLSWKLSEKGYSVTIFEKKEKIGKNACSGLFSEKILEFIPESQKLIQNRIEYCLIHWGPRKREGGGWVGVPKRTLKIKFSRRFLVMSHYELDKLVASLAKNAGARIILNYNISRSDLDIFRDKFERIIGCDGPNSVIRKFLNLPEPTYRLAIQGFIQKSDYSGFVETWPTKSGFIWKIPRGKEIEYGIISDPKGAKLLFDGFLKKNNLKLDRLEAGIVPQGLIIPSHPSITLCGDAVGLTKPWSGGGVIWGLVAANLLLKNFPDFIKYKNTMKRVFLPKIILSKIAVKLVYFLGFKIPWILPKTFKIEGDFLF